MYCTALADKWTKLSDMIANNNLYFAHSTNNGASWFGHREIALDSWAPSALQMGDHIRVFSMNKDGLAQFQKLDQNGWTIISPNEFCINTETGKPFTALNLHVSAVPSPGTGYRLVANDGTLHSIIYYHSQDLKNWTPLRPGNASLLYGGSHSLLTPELWGSKLTFSYGNTQADTHDFQNGEIIMEWDVTITH